MAERMFASSELVSAANTSALSMFSSSSSSSSAASPCSTMVRFRRSETRRARLRVALDELHLVLVLEIAREPEADVAAAGDHHAARRRLLAAHLLHDDADVLARRQEEHLVAVLDDGVALGLDAPAGAVDGRDARVGRRNVLAQRAQCLAHQRSARACADAHQPHAAVGEIQHLQRAGVADQPGDVFGDQLFGADPDVHGDARSRRTACSRSV